MIMLSIVVPVYNVEKYLDRCLESIFSQNADKTQYEVIVVNDGSNDGSLQIAEDYLKQYPENYKIVSQPNGGLSAARNTGLKNARGKYVWFIDSDDFIDDGSLEEIVQNLAVEEVDILTFNYSHPHEDNDIVDKTETNKELKVYTNIDDFFTTGFSTTAWSKVYRVDFMKSNNLHFLEGVIYEDQEFSPRSFFLAKKIKCSPLFSYNYFHRGNSITTQRRKDRSNNFIRIIDSLYEFRKKHVSADQKNINVWFDNKIAFLVSQALKFNDELGLFKTLKSKPYYPLTITDNLSSKDKFKYKLINFNLKLYTLIIKFLEK